MAVELQTALEARLGQQIPLTALTGAGPLSGIAARLLKMLDKRETVEASDDDIVATIMRHEAQVVSADADSVHSA